MTTQQLIQQIRTKKSFLCIGLDVDLNKIPEHLLQTEDPIKRTSQVSSGDRSAKIRTYNYSQGRVTDHRIGLDVFDMDGVMNGKIQKFIDELQLVNNTEKLKEHDVF